MDYLEFQPPLKRDDSDFWTGIEGLAFVEGTSRRIRVSRNGDGSKTAASEITTREAGRLIHRAIKEGVRISVRQVGVLTVGPRKLLSS